MASSSDCGYASWAGNLISLTKPVRGFAGRENVGHVWLWYISSSGDLQQLTGPAADLDTVLRRYGYVLDPADRFTLIPTSHFLSQKH